jgi:hypothetical protein
MRPRPGAPLNTGSRGSHGAPATTTPPSSDSFQPTPLARDRRQPFPFAARATGHPATVTAAANSGSGRDQNAVGHGECPVARLCRLAQRPSRHVHPRAVAGHPPAAPLPARQMVTGKRKSPGGDRAGRLSRRSCGLPVPPPFGYRQKPAPGVHWRADAACARGGFTPAHRGRSHKKAPLMAGLWVATERFRPGAGAPPRTAPRRWPPTR